MTESADGAWVGGRVFTGDAYAEALLVEGGHIVCVGTEQEVRRRKAIGTPIHALHERAIVPGLIDAHLHLLEIARQRVGVDLEGVSSVTELTDRTSRWAGAHPRGPIVGRGWDHEQLSERRYPNHQDLDRVASDRAITLFRICGHVAVVNRFVLEQLEIDRSTPDPPGGRIGHDASGEPDGLLFDSALARLFAAGAGNVEIDLPLMERLLADAARLGLTTVASMNVGAQEVSLVGRLAEQGRLRTRVRFYLSCADWEETRFLRRVSRHSDLRIAGGKMFADGSFGARTARLSEPYQDSPLEFGVEVRSEDELTRLVAAVEAEGLTPAVHAIGDRALEHSLRAFERQERPTSRRIEHASLVLPNAFSRLDTLRPYLIVQPNFVLADWWLEDRLGRARQRWAYPFKTLLDRGYVVAGSSDAPFGSFDPWIGIRAAIGRRDENGRSANPTPQEALSLEEAFQLYSRYGGIALGEPELGLLAPGNPADFVVLDAPRWSTIATQPRLPIVSTWKEGRPTFEAGLAEGSVQ